MHTSSIGHVLIDNDEASISRRGASEMDAKPRSYTLERMVILGSDKLEKIRYLLTRSLF